MTWIKNILRKDSEAPTAPEAKTKGTPPPAPRAPAPDDPPAERLAAILRCRDRELALAWSDALAGDRWLADLAVRGRFAEVRLAAIRRVADPAVLAEVAEASRNKDKGVYRHCQDQLRQRQSADVTAREAAGIADELRVLIAATPLPLSRLLDLEHALQALPGGADDPAVVACQPLLAEAHARLQQEGLLRRDLTQCESQAAELQAAVFGAGSSWPDAETLAAWQTTHAALTAACADAPDWLAALPSTHKLAETLAVLQAALGKLAEDQRRLTAANGFLDALPADAVPDAGQREAWLALPKPGHAQALANLEQRWQALQPKRQAVAPAPAEKAQRKAAAPDQAKQRELVEAFEQALAQGHLAEADTLDKTLGETAPGGALGERFQRARSQLVQLHGWARWGTDQARDHLVTAAEQLQAAGLSVEELTKQVPALREAWKQTSGQGHPRKGQWERFDAALTAAFAPVLAQRAAEAEAHKLVKAAKQAICAEAVAFVGGPAWAETGFDQRLQWRRELIERWRAAGHASFRDERALRKRLDTLLAGVDAQAEAARNTERERRAAIVAAAEAQIEAPDLTRAINEIKGLQRRWNAPEAAARLERKDEQKLWKAFRTACDKVFARRDDERSAQAAAREAQASALRSEREAFAATLEAAAGNSDPRALTEALQAFRRSDAAGDGAGRALEQRAQALIERQTLARHRAQFELMAQKAAIAEALEAAAQGDGADEAARAAAKAGWEALPRLPAKLEAPLAQRLEAAATISAARLAAGTTARAERLLDLEIMLDLPCPPALVEARRLRQLERLKQHFGNAGMPAGDAGEALAHWWATAAPRDESQLARVATIVDRLVQLAGERETRREARPAPRHDDPRRRPQREGDARRPPGRRDRPPQAAR
jgi:hypothetical protein